MVGLAGALFYIVPVLWFYMGRVYASEAAYTKFIGFTLLVIILIAAYGEYQTVFGLLPVEKEFLNYAGFDQHLGNRLERVFSTLASPAEYAILLTLGAVLCFTKVLTRKYQFLILFGVFCVAVFFTSIRGCVVSTLSTTGVLIAVQGRDMKRWLPRLIVTLVLGAAGLFWSLQKVQSGLSPTDTTGLVQHQVVGLLDPLHSTATSHSNLQFYGIFSGVLHPFGLGLVSTTLAATKYGSTGANTEGDFGNMFTALGLVGGIIFTLIVFHTLKEAALHWHRSRSLTSLTALAILVVTFNLWMVGGNYAVAMLIWVTIGYIDRTALKHKLETMDPNEASHGVWDRLRRRRMDASGQRGYGISATATGYPVSPR
jgi:hypothetical protein